MKLNENIVQDFKKLISSPWYETAEIQIVKQLNQQRDNIIKNPGKASDFFKQFIKVNKGLIDDGCSEEFKEQINALAQLQEGKLMKENNQPKSIKLLSDILNYNGHDFTKEDIFLAKKGDTLTWSDEEKCYVTKEKKRVEPGYIAPSMYELKEATLKENFSVEVYDEKEKIKKVYSSSDYNSAKKVFLDLVKKAGGNVRKDITRTSDKLKYGSILGHNLIVLYTENTLQEYDNSEIAMRLRAAKDKPKVQQPQRGMKDVFNNIYNKSPRLQAIDKDLADFYSEYGITPEEAEANPDVLGNDGTLKESNEQRGYFEWEYDVKTKKVEKKGSGVDSELGIGIGYDNSAMFLSDYSKGKLRYKEGTSTSEKEIAEYAQHDIAKFLNKKNIKQRRDFLKLKFKEEKANYEKYNSAIPKNKEILKNIKNRLTHIKNELKQLTQLLNPSIKESEDPCWDGYKMAGMKDKGGKQVPNCIEEDLDSILEWAEMTVDSGRLPNGTEAFEDKPEGYDDEEIINEANTKMYRYYKINFLNESAAKYCAVPHFLIEANTEHETVLEYAKEKDDDVCYIEEIYADEYAENESLDETKNQNVPEEDEEDKWKHMTKSKLKEMDTSDISVTSNPVVQDAASKKRLDALNPFGEENEMETPEKVLEEKFIIFLKRNTSDYKSFIKNGKFQLKEYINSKSFGFVHLLEKEFKKSLQESSNTLEIDDIELDEDTTNILYYYPQDDTDREMPVKTADFMLFLSKVDHNYEDYFRVDTTGNEDYPRGFGKYHDVQEYWSSIPWDEKVKYAKIFLTKVKGVSEFI